MDNVKWMPALILGAGSALVLGLGPDRITPRPLRAPLETVTSSFGEYRAGGDLTISDDERRVAGMDQYIYRVYRADSLRQFSVYVGFYEKQFSGKAIHSPKNCLPGAGWEPLQSSIEPITTASGSGRYNRYLIQKGAERALVLYWYQGRDRIEASEYLVKWQLLRDSAIQRRSDEALVRVLVPMNAEMPEEAANELARRIATQLIPQLEAALPGA